MKHLLYSIFLLLPSLVFTGPIVVQLNTDEQPASVYLSFDGDASFNKSYLNDLDHVAQFDFNYNGKSIVVPRSPELNQLARTDAFKEEKHLKNWQEKGIDLLVIMAIEKGQLKAEVISLTTKQIKVVNAIPLTGDLAQDRRKIHALADTIVETFFRIKGIATSRVAYTNKRRINANKEIAEVWESDYDGANQRCLTKEEALCVTPVYLPAEEGKKSQALCYVSYKTGQPKLKIADLQTGTTRSFFSLRGQQMMPSFSPKRNQLAFITDLTGNPDLFLVDIDASLTPQDKPRQIYGTRYSTQGSPTFSPDGQQIAFVSNKDGKPRIYVMPVPAPGVKMEQIRPTLISKRAVECTAPSWSPDGTKIAYCSKTDKYRQIWVHEITTGKEKQITTGPNDKENPVWARDSLHLLYNGGGETQSDLFLVDILQKRSVAITTGQGQKRFPAWN